MTETFLLPLGSRNTVLAEACESAARMEALRAGGKTSSVVAMIAESKPGCQQMLSSGCLLAPLIRRTRLLCAERTWTTTSMLQLHSGSR